MRRAIILVSGALVLTSCAEQVWKADRSRYTTRNARVTAFEQHSERCKMESRVVGTPSETMNRPQTGQNGDKGQLDEAKFNACMKAAGFTRVKENSEQAQPAEVKPDESPEMKKAATEPPAAEAPAAPPTEAMPPAAAASLAAADSPYRIQLAAYRSRSAAEDELARLQAALPEILGTREAVIVKKNIPKRGTFYGIQTGGFDTRQEARSMCKMLRAKRQDCFAVKNR